MPLPPALAFGFFFPTQRGLKSSMASDPCGLEIAYFQGCACIHANLQTYQTDAGQTAAKNLICGGILVRGSLSIAATLDFFFGGASGASAMMVFTRTVKQQRKIRYREITFLAPETPSERPLLPLQLRVAQMRVSPQGGYILAPKTSSRAHKSLTSTRLTAYITELLTFWQRFPAMFTSNVRTWLFSFF